MNIYIDLKSGNLLTKPSSTTPLTRIDAKRGDSFPFKINFIDTSGINSIDKALPEEYLREWPEGTEIRFTAKKDNLYSGAALVFSEDFIKVGPETRATVVAIGPGAVDSVAIQNAGIGYSSAPTVTFTSIDGKGSGAEGVAMVSDGAVAGFSVINGGSGYMEMPSLRITREAVIEAASLTAAIGEASAFVTLTITGHGAGEEEITLSGLSFTGTDYNGKVTVTRATDNTLTFPATGVTNVQLGSSPLATFAGSVIGSGAIIEPVLDDGEITEWVVINGGSNYRSDCIATVTGGNGSGATVSTLTTHPSSLTSIQVLSNSVNLPGGCLVSITGGLELTAINLTEGGSGYTAAPAVSFTGGGGSGAAATALVSDGKVVGISITNPGTGYASAPTISLATGIGLKTASLTAVGSGYTSVPTVVFAGGGGTGAAATVTVANGSVNSITITNAGSNYTSAPTLSFTGGGGTGAAASVTIGTAATATATIGTPATGYGWVGLNGKILEVNLHNAGSGYTSVPTVTVTSSDGGASATPCVVEAVLEDIMLKEITITDAGSGYYFPPPPAPPVIIAPPTTSSTTSPTTGSTTPAIFGTPETVNVIVDNGPFSLGRTVVVKVVVGGQLSFEAAIGTTGHDPANSQRWYAGAARPPALDLSTHLFHQVGGGSKGGTYSQQRYLFHGHQNLRNPEYEYVTVPVRNDYIGWIKYQYNQLPTGWIPIEGSGVEQEVVVYDDARIHDWNGGFSGKVNDMRDAQEVIRKKNEEALISGSKSGYQIPSYPPEVQAQMDADRKAAADEFQRKLDIMMGEVATIPVTVYVPPIINNTPTVTITTPYVPPTIPPYTPPEIIGVTTPYQHTPTEIISTPKDTVTDPNITKEGYGKINYGGYYTSEPGPAVPVKDREMVGFQDFPPYSPKFKEFIRYIAGPVTKVWVPYTGPPTRVELTNCGAAKALAKMENGSVVSIDVSGISLVRGLPSAKIVGTGSGATAVVRTKKAGIFKVDITETGDLTDASGSEGLQNNKNYFVCPSVLTFTENPVDGDTVTIGSRVYTFKSSLTSPAVPNEVKIGVDTTVSVAIAKSVSNLVAAINNGTAAGTAYSTGTLDHAEVEAVLFSEDVVHKMGITAPLVQKDKLPTLVLPAASSRMAWNKDYLQGSGVSLEENSYGSVSPKYAWNGPIPESASFEETPKVVGPFGGLVSSVRMTERKVASYKVTNGGSGYKRFPEITVSPNNNAIPNAKLSLYVVPGFESLQVRIDDPGTGLGQFNAFAGFRYRHKEVLVGGRTEERWEICNFKLYVDGNGAIKSVDSPANANYRSQTGDSGNDYRYRVYDAAARAYINVSASRLSSFNYGELIKFPNLQGGVTFPIYSSPNYNQTTPAVFTLYGEETDGVITSIKPEEGYVQGATVKTPLLREWKDGYTIGPAYTGGSGAVIEPIMTPVTVQSASQVTYPEGSNPFSVVFSGGGGWQASARVRFGYGIERVDVVENLSTPLWPTRFAKDVPVTVSGTGGAWITATVEDGRVVSFEVINPGKGYIDPPMIRVYMPNTNSNVIHCDGKAVLTGNKIPSVVIESKGSDYESPPTVTFKRNSTTVAGVKAHATLYETQVLSVEVTNRGSGYSNQSA